MTFNGTAFRDVRQAVASPVAVAIVLLLLAIALNDIVLKWY